MRRGFCFKEGHLVAKGDEDGLGHALVEGDDVVTLRVFVSGVAEAADDGGVAAVRDLDEAARLEPGGPRSTLAVEDLVAKGRLLAHATTTCLVFEIPGPGAKGM